jgi:hypothetical protein
MNEKLFDISNESSLNVIDQSVYDSFNEFMFSNDIKLMGKLLHRFKYFLDTKHLPGDIVEVGVFKGSGVASFSKFIQIFCPNSNKKVIGFDIFDVNIAKEVLEKDGNNDKENMLTVYDRVNHQDLTYKSVYDTLINAGINQDKFKLVKGDVQQSIPQFLNDNPGFRVSLLYVDLDLDRPVYESMVHLWDRILPGGIVLFDEYEYHKFSESNGVDRFLKERNIEYKLCSTDWIAPTCFLRKETF